MSNRSRGWRRRSQLALAVPVALFAVTACNNTSSTRSATSSDSPSVTDTSPATSSPTDEAAAGGSRTDAEAAFVRRMKAGTSGEQTAHVAMRLTGATKMTASGVTGSGGALGNRARITLRITSLGNRSIDLVVVDNAVYMAIQGVTPAGKFFKVPLGGQAAGLAGLSEGLSAQKALANLARGLKSVRDLGPATVGGTATEQYRVEVDTGKATRGLGIGAMAALPPTLTYTVWIARDDHVRRMTYSASGLHFAMDFTRWGEPVTVKAPARSDLVAAPQGLSAAG